MGRGGAIFFCSVMNGAKEDSDGVVVMASGKLLGECCVSVGQMWRVHGPQEPRRRKVNGYSVVEQHLTAEALELVLPVGEEVVRFLADGEGFPGISSTKARALWDMFGDRIYALLDCCDYGTIARAKGLSLKSAEAACRGWRMYGDERTFQWLQSHGVQAAVGRSFSTHFGSAARSALKVDPYRLLSYGASWGATETIARELIAVAADDPRRVSGAVEEVLYRAFRDGDTTLPQAMVADGLKGLLDFSAREAETLAFSGKAAAYAREQGSYIFDSLGRLQQLGAYAMESAVASFLARRLQVDSSSSVTAEERGRIDSIIESFQAGEEIVLNAEQRSAVHAAAHNWLTVVTGGAGVGKTTVLKAIYRVLDASGVRVFQCALAGRAAKRMQEATGKPARTIASLVLNLTESDFEGPCVLSLDEASMVDILSMYRLCMVLPPHVRILLLGDHFQLMPVGPGLVLHEIVSNKHVPVVALNVGMRFGSEIAGVANGIRQGEWTPLPDDLQSPVAFRSRALVQRGEDGEPGCPLAEEVVQLFLQAPLDTQILTPRRTGPAGVKALNELCQQSYSADAPEAMLWNPEFSTFAGTGFRRGDPVVATRNIWADGLQNGSLGRLVEVFEPQRPMGNDENVDPSRMLGWIEWDDGVRRPLTIALLKDLELAYALTVHKAQGSQWGRVIVAVTPTRLLDRTLLYTAITRARHEVVLVGDEAVARAAAEAPPRFDGRMTGLALHLEHQLQRTSVTTPNAAACLVH